MWLGSMITRRRVLVVAFAAYAGLPAALAASDPIYKVSGTVTDTNFDGLSSFLLNSIDSIVGFKLFIPSNDSYGNGVTTEESNGMLAVFRKNSDVEVAISSGYSYR